MASLKSRKTRDKSGRTREKEYRFSTQPSTAEPGESHLRLEDGESMFEHPDKVPINLAACNTAAVMPETTLDESGGNAPNIGAGPSSTSPAPVMQDATSHGLASSEMISSPKGATQGEIPSKCTEMLNFEEFPTEIRGMIWREALDAAPTLVDVFYNRSSHRFEIANGTADILSVCGLAFLPKYFKPIYLPSWTFESQGRSRWSTPRWITDTFPTPAYIRPECDIIYPRTGLQHLDRAEFLRRPENHMLQHLAINPYHVLGSSSHADFFLRLVSEMNLKSVYVIDGAEMDAESHTSQTRTWPECDVLLVDPPDTHVSDDPGQPMFQRSRWTRKQFDRVMSEVHKYDVQAAILGRQSLRDKAVNFICKIVERRKHGVLHQPLYKDWWDDDY